MVNFGTIVREPINGTPFATIPFGDWLYFEYHQVINDVSRTQGILSPFKTPQYINVFQMENAERLDYIMNVWFKPYAIANANNSGLRFTLDEQFLVRYQRVEHLNDGRPRDTFIGRSKDQLLERCIIPPPQDPLSAPYLPGTPLRVPPHEVLSNAFPQPIPIGAGAWALPTSEGYEGTFPVPSTQFVGTSTAHRMCQIVEYCKLYINPDALKDVTIANPPTSGGILNHPIDFRYDNLLTALQKMSAATWSAWYNGNLANNRLPVDFALLPDPSKPNGWIFTVFAGGAGADRTLDEVMGGGGEKVFLSTSNDNITQPVSIRDRTQEKNRIWVGGKNEGASRDVLVVMDGDDVGLSPWNRIDKFIHSAKIPPFKFTGAADDGIFDAITRGKERLKEEAPRNEYSVLLRFNRNLRKGVNLNVGDLVSANLFDRGINNYQVIKMRHVISRTGGVTIRVELAELDGNRFKGGDVFQEIINRQKQQETDLQYTGEAI